MGIPLSLSSTMPLGIRLPTDPLTATFSTKGSPAVTVSEAVEATVVVGACPTFTLMVEVLVRKS